MANGQLKKRILIVEDHADTRIVTARLLNREGYHVHSARDVAEAMKLCGQEKFDLLLGDIGLPDGDGLQLMRDIAEKCGIKGIAYSAHAYEKDKAAAKAAGFSAFLAKPVDSQVLLRTIADIFKEPHT